LTNSSARLAPDRAAEAFQASKRPAATSSQSAVQLGGAGNHLAGPESGQHLCPNTLKPAKHAVSRLEVGLNRQELFLERPASVRRDLSTSLPLRLAVGLDDLVG
jgi:hypothetical protein